MGKEKKLTIGIIENYLIKNYGIFDYEGFLSTINKWFSQHKYDFIEKAHTEKNKSEGKEIESEWVASRKIDDYVKFEINIKYWIRNLTDIGLETEKGVEKKQKGKIELKINTKITKNHKKKWETRPNTFGNFIRELYEKLVIKNTLDNAEDKLFNESQDLIKKIKINFKT